MNRKLGSWDRPKDASVHNKEDIAVLRESIRFGLRKKYYGIAETMWSYDFGGDPAVQDMLTMSRDTVPEYFLIKNGECVWFEYAGNMYCLPFAVNGGINIYGKPTSWSPMPVGCTALNKDRYSPIVQEIMSLQLDDTNSVIMRNDLFGGNDESYIDAMIDELVDNTLTMNQLQLVAKCPFIFSVTEDNLPNARLFFAKMANDEPVIFTNRYGDDVAPMIESTQAVIDPALFEIFDRFECQILEYIGLPCVPITKRAQQTVSEVSSNDDKIGLRRMEKLRQREQAIDRINKVFGKSYSVVSVIDQRMEEQQQMLQLQSAQQEGNDNARGDKDGDD